MAATKELLEGVATYLAAAGVGLTWNANAIYTADQTGILFMHVPAAPHRVVVLALIPTSADPSMPLGAAMLQVRGRGLPDQPLDVGELLDPIFDILHGRTGWAVGGQIIRQVLRRVVAPMGRDDTGRWERVDQYYLDIDAAPTPLRPEGGSW